jgi:hypothetical protein
MTTKTALKPLTTGHELRLRSAHNQYRLYPHVESPDHGSHYDYEGPAGKYRLYPDGGIEAK